MVPDCLTGVTVHALCVLKRTPVCGLRIVETRTSPPMDLSADAGVMARLPVLSQFSRSYRVASMSWARSHKVHPLF